MTAPRRRTGPAHLTSAERRGSRPDPADPATWRVRPPSPARTVAVVLQAIALGLVTIAVLASVWWLATSTRGATPGTVVSAALLLPLGAAMLWLGITGLRRWLAGGPPARLYGFDALPVAFLIATAGPAALQDILGLGVTVAFVLPGLATYLATPH
ncbi:MAG: hypothetical protein ABIV26_01565 [Candidatus Limnocylindrales bacterium]